MRKIWHALILFTVVALVLVVSNLAFAAKPSPEFIKQIVADSFQKKIGDCTIYGVPSGVAVKVRVECKETSDVGIPVGMVLGAEGYSFCGVQAETGRDKKTGYYLGVFDVLVGNCTK